MLYLLFEKKEPMPWCLSPRTNSINIVSSGAWRHAPGRLNYLRTLTGAEARAELYLKSIGTGNIDFSSSNLGSAGFQLEFSNGLPGYIKCIFQGVNNNILNNTTVKLKRYRRCTPIG